MSTCQADGFDYYNSSGASVLGVPVDGFCGVFAGAACNATSQSIGQCCTVTQNSQKRQQMAQYIMYVSWLPLGTWMYLMISAKNKKAAEAKAQGIDMSEFDPIGRLIPEGLPQKIWKMSFGIFLGLSIYGAIAVANSQQQAFSVTTRNALGASMAFLTPLESLFQFLEDTVTVQINYSLAAGTKKKTNEIFWTSVRNALLSGVVASVVCTILATSQKALGQIVAPGASHDASLYPGCSLVESEGDVANAARPFFELYVWRFPFTFVNLVVSGLLFGARQIELMGAIFVCGEVALLATWVWAPSPSERQDNTELLGTAFLLQSSVVSVIAFAALSLCKPIQDFTGVTFDFFTPEPSSLSEQLQAKDAEQNTGRAHFALSALQRELLADGGKVLAMDLCLQLSSTITFYVALMHSAPTAYQLTALGAALPEYGLAYVIGIRFIAKIVGSQLLARGLHKQYVLFAKTALVATVAILAVALSVVIAYRDTIAYEYGYNACEFAGSAECFPVYEAVFGGTNPLPSNFDIFAAVVLIDGVFNVLRGLILSCLDFNFIGVAAAAAFFCVYLPAILIAYAAGATVRGLYLAQNAPLLFLAAGHLWRLLQNTTKMREGESGPWSKAVAPDDGESARDDPDDLSYSAYD
mmetsp:Transcript_14934/g.44365  ORF Transcript_14934/g.44365 Transcript_14934/m.44365 type:complete len:639 (+) Transcript_14934:88-2004(+)